MKHQVTIKDLANKLGLSTSTISRALSDHPDISIKTKKAVRELADLLGYKPNQIALNLRTKTTKTIGLIVPEISHYFFSRIVSGIEDYAYDNDYSVVLFQTNESYKREVLNIQSLMSSRVDGVLASPSKETNDYSHFKQLIDNGIPLVLFDRTTDELPVDMVSVDDYEGAFKATEHLINCGCRRIAFFSAPLNLSVGRNRFNGYKSALDAYNIPFEEKLVYYCDTLQESNKTARLILKKDDSPDGIFTVNDESAIGAMLAAKAIGLFIPNDLKIVGFENSKSASMTDPLLSSVDQFGYEVGKEAVTLLFRRIMSDNQYYNPRKVIIKTKLIQRNSSKLE